MAVYCAEEELNRANLEWYYGGVPIKPDDTPLKVMMV
jgi:hypothetical protein